MTLRGYAHSQHTTASDHTHASPHSQVIHPTALERPSPCACGTGGLKNHPACKNPSLSPTSFQTLHKLHQYFNTYHLHHPWIFNLLLSFHSATCHGPTCIAATSPKRKVPSVAPCPVITYENNTKSFLIDTSPLREGPC